jgi:hypothetical protein
MRHYGQYGQPSVTLAKVGVEGSNPFARSSAFRRGIAVLFHTPNAPHFPGFWPRPQAAAIRSRNAFSQAEIGDSFVDDVRARDGLAPYQKLLGIFSTCVPTWLRMRLVEIGAT